jgi:hypothetical protein
MIVVGTIIRKKIIEVLQDAIYPVPIYSIMPPDNINKYVIIQNLSENQLDEKRAFITEGFISISCIEKFIGRDGDFDGVTALAKTIKQLIYPTTVSRFGIVENINIFTMSIDSVTDEMFNNPNGRTAMVTLRLNFKAQNI